ncbi:MAG: BtpA/SgcQ family protein [Acholeplasmataceae bacterium]|nr:BtpA/SgcQ family protein [Acholeplasmataceae bacterium]
MKNVFHNMKRPFVIGMVHCLPLPGTAHFNNDIGVIIAQAVQDAKTLEKAGVDGIIIENMGDGPFAAKLDTEQVSALAAVTAYVSKEISIPFGIDAAFNDYAAALSIAKITGAQFVRIPVFVDTVVYYGGIINPCAREAVIYRRKLQAEHIAIFADIQVKHTHLLIPSISIEESAKNAVACGADAVIVTGATIGTETPIEIIQRVKKVIKVPVIAGSGVNADNICKQLKIADGAIVGSSLKEGGVLTNPISYPLTRQMIETFKKGS